MAKNPPARRYRVWHLAGSSDAAKIAHFAVQGARVDEFAICHELARIMQAALNSPSLTPREWKVIRSSLAFAEAGEGPDHWTDQDAKTARSLLEKL